MDAGRVVVDDRPGRHCASEMGFAASPDVWSLVVPLFLQVVPFFRQLVEDIADIGIAQNGRLQRTPAADLPIGKEWNKAIWAARWRIPACSLSRSGSIHPEIEFRTSFVFVERGLREAQAEFQRPAFRHEVHASGVLATEELHQLPSGVLVFGVVGDGVKADVTPCAAPDFIGARYQSVLDVAGGIGLVLDRSSPSKCNRWWSCMTGGAGCHQQRTVIVGDRSGIDQPGVQSFGQPVERLPGRAALKLEERVEIIIKEAAATRCGQRLPIRAADNFHHCAIASGWDNRRRRRL